MIVNTREFQRASLHFNKYNTYCAAPPGTHEYKQFWDEEVRRCLEGYSVGGEEITGYHYFYLNYCPILRTELDSFEITGQRKSGRKILDFPAFWDGDMRYFKFIDKAIQDGKHAVVLKARGKGYSYKGAAMCDRNFFLKRKSKNFVLASEKEFLIKDGFLTKTWDFMSFINDNTAWTKRRQKVDRDMHKRASYIEYTNGTEIEKGYMSEIMGVTLKDDPEKARGKRGELVFFEEAGKFPDLLEAWTVSRPSVEDGKITVGTLIAFGTGGSEGSDFAGLRELFYSPEAYNIYTHENIWDEGAQGTRCGYFVPAYENATGFMDSDGNSDEAQAKGFYNEERANIRKEAKDPTQIDRFVAEAPFTPREAMLSIGANNLPVAELQAWQNYLYSHPHLINIGVSGKLLRIPEGIKFLPDDTCKPIYNYPHNPKEDNSGCIVQYQAPYRDPDSNRVPAHLYIICHDPYAQDATTGVISLGSAWVIKRTNNLSQPDDMIVASYVGRPHTTDEYNENLFKLAEYYNAKVAFENDRGDVIGYAKRTRKLHLLEEEFEMEYNSNLPKSSVKRGYGMHMTAQRKSQGELYLRDWLKIPRGKTVNGEYKLNMHLIYDPALLEELIKFNREGNFDRVMSLMVGMYYLKEIEFKQLNVKKPPEKNGFFDDLNKFY
jgi:hypothetical protein